jgi:thiamine-monophosphate kinase
MIDVSDGLLADLGHIADESGVGFALDEVPVAPGATLDQALTGGDDYELLFTAGSNARVPRSIAGVPVHRIGRMLRRQAGRPQMTLMKDGRRSELKPEGWQHF